MRKELSKDIKGPLYSYFSKTFNNYYTLPSVGIAAILRTSVVNLESFYAEERPNEENRASWVGAKRRMPAHSNLAEVVGDIGNRVSYAFFMSLSPSPLRYIIY